MKNFFKKIALSVLQLGVLQFKLGLFVIKSLIAACVLSSVVKGGPLLCQLAVYLAASEPMLRAVNWIFEPVCKPCCDALDEVWKWSSREKRRINARAKGKTIATNLQGTREYTIIDRAKDEVRKHFIDRRVDDFRTILKKTAWFVGFGISIVASGTLISLPAFSSNGMLIANVLFGAPLISAGNFSLASLHTELGDITETGMEYILDWIGIYEQNSDFDISDQIDGDISEIDTYSMTDSLEYSKESNYSKTNKNDVAIQKSPVQKNSNTSKECTLEKIPIASSKGRDL
ncbi:MAG: hypothetical protein J6Y29_02460 [Clostridiales bacterium]|nr:hypothetical protein [Clostridiales bacterium]